MINSVHRNMEFGKPNKNTFNKLHEKNEASDQKLNRLLQKLQFFIVHGLDPMMDNELRTYLLNR